MVPSRLPPRSRLYSLAPIGIGTAFVESVTGYVARLADAHSVSVGDLVGRVLSDLASPEDPIVTKTAKAVRANGHGFRASSYAPNGITGVANRWVRALQAATYRSDLQFLSLLPFRDIFPGGCFRKRRAWCPQCFEQWRSDGQRVYEPLIWSIKTATHCLVHHRQLDRVCNHCARTLSPLGVFSRPGYCERCDGWLGLSDRKDSQLRPEMPSEDGDWLSSVQVGNLLELLPAIDTPKAREVFCSNLRRYLEYITNNNVAAFAEYIRCPPSILGNWLDGATVPTLENLLRTCKCLGVSTVSLVTSDGPSAADLHTAKAATAEAGKRDVAPFRNKSEIRRGLEKALTDEVPRSLFKVAQAMGYTSTERLYQADRRLCHKIAARYRQSGHSHWWKRPGATRICEIPQMKQALERSLQLTEPLSVHHIAAQLGYSNDAYVRKMFPDLCTTISKKLTALKQARPLKIRIALKKALSEDPAPTLADLSRRLGYSTSTVLRAHEPHLCDQLASRNESQARRHRANMERSARAFLKQMPVPSVNEVCERLGITLWFMTKYFPSVRRIIAEKRRLVNLNNARRRRQQLFRDTYDIAICLHRQGEYPSISRICQSLPKDSCREWKALHLAARTARQALGV
jgi:hypothetical protein